MSMHAYVATMKSPFGAIAFGWSGQNIVALKVGIEAMDQVKWDLERLGYTPREAWDETGRILEQEMHAYLSGERKEFSVQPVFYGTSFQQRVWRELMQVSYGSIVSYAELAERSGFPRAARAAGTVMAANRIAIVVPCHRVITSGNRLGGYGYGLEMKKALLRLEGVSF